MMVDGIFKQFHHRSVEVPRTKLNVVHLLQIQRIDPIFNFTQLLNFFSANKHKCSISFAAKTKQNTKTYFSFNLGCGNRS